MWTVTQDRLRHWLFDQSLPLWAKAGQDDQGRFYEKLDLSGQPITGLARRTRLQARQTYVFTEAYALGWLEGERLARFGLETLIRDYGRQDGLWVRALDDAGRIHDDTPDLYDLAFVLFALASAHRVFKDERALPLALKTLDAINRLMSEPSGGWSESLPPVLPRRQNPHMHMLEALLAWHEIAPDPAFETAAGNLISLFSRHFLDREHLVLGEFYGHDWSIRPGSEGQTIEPGHHLEWVWLLDEAKRLGLGDQSSAARALYTTALTCGLAPNGLAVREITRIGQIKNGGTRLWGQTELLRTLATRGDLSRASAVTETLFATHLATQTKGLWFDTFDSEGLHHDTTVPASTLYHLMTAIKAVLSTPQND